MISKYGYFKWILQTQFPFVPCSYLSVVAKSCESIRKETELQHIAEKPLFASSLLYKHVLP